jgi:hypothetical protein
MRNETEQVDRDIEENTMNKVIQEENNKYEQKLKLGSKITYG